MRLNGGGNQDTIILDVQLNGGLNATLLQKTLSLADYEFDGNNQLVSGQLGTDITHADVQSALIQNAKTVNPGLFPSLLNGTVSEYPINVSVSREVTSLGITSLQEELDALKVAVAALPATWSYTQITVQAKDIKINENQLVAADHGLSNGDLVDVTAPTSFSEQYYVINVNGDAFQLANKSEYETNARNVLATDLPKPASMTKLTKLSSANPFSK